jgi:site-specific DNA-adenine methylase
MGNFFQNLFNTGASVVSNVKNTLAQQEAARKKALADNQKKLQDFEQKFFVKPAQAIKQKAIQGINKVKELPFYPSSGAFNVGYKKDTQGNPQPLGFEDLFKPPQTYYYPPGSTEESPVEQLKVKDFLDPKSYQGGKVGKALASDINAVLGGFMMNLPAGSVATGLPALSAKAALKGAGILTALNVTLRKLQGEPINPIELAGSALLGGFFGLLEPTPLESASVTELGAARKGLADYGFKLEDYANPTVLRQKFNVAVKDLHPDRGGNPEEFKTFMNNFKVATSAEAPAEAMSSFEGIQNWVRNLWRKKPAEAKPQEGAIVPKGGLLEAPAEIKTPADLETSLTKRAFDVANNALTAGKEKDVAYVAGRQELTKFLSTAVKEIATQYKITATPKTSIVDEIKKVPEAAQALDIAERSMIKAGDVLYASWQGPAGVAQANAIAKSMGPDVAAVTGDISQNLKDQGITFENGKVVVQPQVPLSVQPKGVGGEENTWIRKANVANRNTDTIRGGTWYADKQGVQTIEGVDTIGGSNSYPLTGEPKNPLIIKDAILDDGSFAVINSGYENFIPSKYSKIAEDLYRWTIGAGKITNPSKTISNSLIKAGATRNQINNILTLTKKNQIDSAMDFIISKGLKERGYDGLILEGGGGGKHLFKISTPPPKVLTQPKGVEVNPQVSAEIAPIETPPVQPQAPQPQQPVTASGVGETPVAIKPSSKTTLAQVEKADVEQRFTSYLNQSTSQADYVKRVNTMSKVLDKPDFRSDPTKLRQVRALVQRQLMKLTGQDLVHWKQRYAMLEMMKADPEVADSAKALEDLVIKLDEAIGSNRAKVQIETVRTDLNLPIEGKYHITYGKYSTAGTGNREWVQENIPLLRMGNKRGMLGYILDVLGIKQKDLGSIAPEDVKQLSKINNVVDTFGGSGLMSNLSKKFFPDAKITYNELDPHVIKAIQKAQKEPRVIQKFVSEIAYWLDKHPGSDWLGHFNLVYKTDENFRTAAYLIESAAGRTEITPLKLRNLIKAIPSFSKVFKGIEIKNIDALKLIDKYIRKGTPKDFLWIDPPYLWSTGYGVGAEMEKAPGFTKLLDQLEQLNNKGVKFVFFNNDPEVQVAKAGMESVHLNNIMGKVNKLSEEGMIVIKGINPIGTTARKEMMITNLKYGLDTGRLLNLKEVVSAIEKLKDDPATAPQAMLKLYRDIRGSTDLIPAGDRISAFQIRTIRSLKNRLRIKNREMEPVLNELLGDTSFAKMTKEDGIKMIEWLQPRNFDVIENKIAQTRQMLTKERHEAALGGRFVSKHTSLEDKFRVIAGINKTVDDIENLSRMLDMTPPPEPMKPSFWRTIASYPAEYISEDFASNILGIKNSFHSPLKRIIIISNNLQNRMKRDLGNVFKDLSENEQQQVIYLQAGAEKLFKGSITDKAREVADYIQEVSEANIAIVNRLREAKGQPALAVRKPYIPYIISENLAQAANLFDRAKFWEQRTKTPEDFAAGLFTKDPGRIVEIWSQSTSSWLKKNLYGTFLVDRFESLYQVGTPAAVYAREMAMMDIYDMLPESEKFSRSIGAAMNAHVGAIWPKKIKVDEALAKSVLNTTFGQELRENIENGYLTVPRLSLPNLGSVFHKVFYPAKLGWQFSFPLLNLTQPTSGLPFIGLESWVAGKVKLAGVLFPWNRAIRKNYVRILEESGYEYGRVIEGQTIPQFHQKFLNFVDRGVNFLGDVTEFMNRIESMAGAEYFLGKQEKTMGIKMSSEEKSNIAAQFSAFINFLGGKGYAPLAQRSTVGRFLYTFGQFPINQLNVYERQIEYTFKDKGTADFWKMMGREGGATPEVMEAFDKLPPRSKANVFLIFLAMAIPVAILYALSRSWNVASRALPGIPRVVSADLMIAIAEWQASPSADTVSKLKSAIKQFFSVRSLSAVNDALNITKFGVLQTASGRPLFVDRTWQNALKTFIWGRSSLDQYENAYPSILGRTLGGKTEAGAAEKLANERAGTASQETQQAVDIVKWLNTHKGFEERKAYFTDLSAKGKLTDNTLAKLKQYLTEEGKGTGPLESSIAGLNDVDQAKFVLDKITAVQGQAARLAVIQNLKSRGLITDNVIASMKDVLKAGYKANNVNILDKFKGLFQ